ncbi:MAG: hypothetical protein ACI4HQ_05795 [Acetatifactor sp.]
MSSIPNILIGKEGLPLALYGLGTESERLLKQLPTEYNIVGLLDGFRTNGELYGKRIITIDEAIEIGVSLIIVVARPGSCKAIAKRIAQKCIENNIKVFDIRGKDLLNCTRDIFSKEKMRIFLKDIFISTTNETDKIKVKLFGNKLKNTQIDTEGDGNVVVRDAYDIGYLFCGPIITDFVLWLNESVKAKGIPNVFFCARDGYLLKQLYELLEDKKNVVYFYTSRMAAIRAGVESIADIQYVDSMKFSGSLSENLAERFGILINEIPSEATILDYADIILDKAQNVRLGYKKYIEHLKIENGDIGLVDFVAKGTTQFFTQRLMNNHFIGFYFMQLEPEFMKDKKLDIISFYTTKELDDSAVFDNYYILETVLTSEEASAVEFSELGEVIFADETRKIKDIDCFKRAQRGIIDYFKEYLYLSSGKDMRINKQLDEVFLKLIHNVEILDRDFVELIVEDSFFHRMTDIADILL